MDTEFRESIPKIPEKIIAVVDCNDETYTFSQIMTTDNKGLQCINYDGKYRIEKKENSQNGYIKEAIPACFPSNESKGVTYCHLPGPSVPGENKTYFIQKLLKGAAEVKFVVVISHETIYKTERFDDIMNTYLEYVANIIGDITKFNGSVALVVNNYCKLSVGPEESDKDEQSKIAKALENLKQNEGDNKNNLIEIFLNKTNIRDKEAIDNPNTQKIKKSSKKGDTEIPKTDDDWTYPRILLLHKPTRDVTLDKSKSLQEDKRRIQAVVENMPYIATLGINFAVSNPTNK